MRLAAILGIVAWNTVFWESASLPGGDETKSAQKEPLSVAQREDLERANAQLNADSEKLFAAKKYSECVSLEKQRLAILQRLYPEDGDSPERRQIADVRLNLAAVHNY